MLSTKSMKLILVVLFGMPAPVVIAGAGHSDFVVGRNADDALAVEGPPGFIDGPLFIDLEPADGIFTDYYTAMEPGWEHLEMEEPDENFFRLAAGHRVGLKRLSFSSGFGMFDPFTANPILESDGDVYPLYLNGTVPDFHIDLIFAAGPDPAPGSAYVGMFQLVDESGAYVASAPFALNFRAVPEPSTAGLMGVCCDLVASTRRRRKDSDM